MTTLTPEEWRALQKPSAQLDSHKWDLRGQCTRCRLMKHPLTLNEPCRANKHKFKAKQTIVDGKTFPSRLEARVYETLKIREFAGEIKDVVLQPTVFLSDAKISYKPDFAATYTKTNLGFYVEGKGVATDRWRLIKKLWRAYGPSPLEVYKANGKNIYLDETIMPGETK